MRRRVSDEHPVISNRFDQSTTFTIHIDEKTPVKVHVKHKDSMLVTWDSEVIKSWDPDSGILIFGATPRHKKSSEHAAEETQLHQDIDQVLKQRDAAPEQVLPHIMDLVKKLLDKTHRGPGDGVITITTENSGGTEPAILEYYATYSS